MKITRRNLLKLIRESFLFEASDIELAGSTATSNDHVDTYSIPSDLDLQFNFTDKILTNSSTSTESQIVEIELDNTAETVLLTYSDGEQEKITDRTDYINIKSQLETALAPPVQQTPATPEPPPAAKKWASSWDAYVKATPGSGDLVRDGWAALAESGKLPAGYDGSYKSWQKWYKAVNQPQLRADIGRSGQYLYPADILAMYETFQSDDSEAKGVQEEIKKELEIPQGKSINQTTIEITAEPMQAVYKTPKWKKAINWVKQKKADHEAKISARKEKRSAKKQGK